MRHFYKHVFAVFFCHWISTVGVVITSTSAIVFLGFQFRSFTNPYDALIIFVLVPAFFVAGLILVPIGLYLRSRVEGGVRAVWAAVVWDDARLLRLSLVVLSATMVNVVLMSAASYQGLQYLDSNQFCGVVCHNPMSPQFEAHQFSPHASVACVDCHVGPGPSSFLRSKVAGLGRVKAVLLDSYDRPLRISDENRQPVVAACENCHWREQKQGEPLRLIRHYDDDEESTLRSTLLLMRVDTAIHATHVGRDIYYIAEDRERQIIPWVSSDGVEYVSGDVPEVEPVRMGCLDCHNRAAHSFGSPERAVDDAIAEGRVDRSIPFAKRNTLEAVLQADGAAPASAAEAEILRRNIFPSVNVTWDSYPDNIGHELYPGCFRCHDSQHTAESGEVISQNCFACHELLAIGEREPEILEQLGIAR